MTPEHRVPLPPPQVQCVTDEMGFVLFDRTTPSTHAGGCPSIDRFGPYCVEQYLIMALLSKQVRVRVRVRVRVT